MVASFVKKQDEMAIYLSILGVIIACLFCLKKLIFGKANNYQNVPIVNES